MKQSIRVNLEDLPHCDLTLLGKIIQDRKGYNTMNIFSVWFVIYRIW